MVSRTPCNVAKFQSLKLLFLTSGALDQVYVNHHFEDNKNYLYIMEYD